MLTRRKRISTRPTAALGFAPSAGTPPRRGPRPGSESRRGGASLVRTVLPPVLLALPLVLAAWSLSKSQLPPADFTFNNGTEVATLDPAVVTGVPEGRILRAIFEGLTVKDPETLAALPGMAESWTISDDGLVYTFKIRENAFWTNGDQLTAHDFVFSWERFLNPLTAAEYAYQLWYVKGAKAYTTTVDPNTGAPTLSFDTVGIRAADDFTLEVVLEKPTEFFLQLTGFYPMFPVNERNIAEAMEKYPGDAWKLEWLKPENIVTNGPYKVGFRRVNDRIRLEKNELYWDADAVAFQSIDALAVENYTTGLNLYLQGDAYWLDVVPTMLVPRLLEREDYSPMPYFGTYFYRVNVTREPFDDPRIRRALALTIDRKRITEKITKSGQIPWYSFVPYGMDGYEYAEMERKADLDGNYDVTFADDCREAAALMKEAGYGAGGKPLPTIEILYNTSEAHRDIAEVVADSWQRNLGLTAKLANQEWKVYLGSQTNLDYDVSRSAWIGDYIDPNTFLDLFLDGGENNKTGWGNARYDELIYAAKKERDPAQRFEYFREAEAILMDELPVIPIYSYVTQNMLNPRVGGFPGNLLNEQFPKWWYLRSDEELDAYRATQPEYYETNAVVDAPGPKGGIYPPSAPRGRFPDGDPRQRLSPLHD
ncbi:Oligopeptide-binding protein OppA precursor [Planctomycetes bacterium Pla163]|uniref:Oligopeptide-binding protein OppA n=1 Tax=Rohdeia mirabilis TaxID=2528008 RepID=A0A518D2G6_9BACT|nr:Oligopeptide-binding protein OppA precursor [Planctomycetes bacterium Pla163]